MDLIHGIREKVEQNRFEFSKHAADQAILRNIRVGEMREAIARGQVIEDYPNDKYGPSCLVFGLTQAGRPLHVQLSVKAAGQDHHPLRARSGSLDRLQGQED